MVFGLNEKMVKFHVLCCRALLRVFIATEALVLNCMQRHRLKIIYLLHPISAAVLLLVVGFFTWYEMLCILPEICDTNGGFYKLYWVLTLYLLHNILGNMLYCWRTDTSFLSVARERQQPVAAEAHLWHLCTHCQMLVPPRAWHCRVCNTCMLKRDHHCNIMANCVGLTNQRYFVALLLHLTIGNLLSIVYNVFYVFKMRLAVFSEPILLLAQIDEAILDTLKAYPHWLIINGAILKLMIFSLVFVAVQLGVQLYMISRGSCMYAIRDRSYDVGFWTNWRLVLGKRMFWTWLTPLVNSPLPYDGTQWNFSTKTSAKKPA